MAPVTENIMYKKLSGKTFGIRWLKMMRHLLPPATSAASMYGLTFTANAWDLRMMAVPPNPPRTPKTSASSVSVKLGMTKLSTMSSAIPGSMSKRSANRMNAVSIQPPK